MPSGELIQEITSLIIDAVNLHHVDPRTLNAQTSLRTGGLELDSIDILEIVVVVEQKYGLKVANAEVGAQAFKTIGSIAEFVSRK